MVSVLKSVWERLMHKDKLIFLEKELEVHRESSLLHNGPRSPVKNAFKHYSCYSHFKPANECAISALQSSKESYSFLQYDSQS